MATTTYRVLGGHQVTSTPAYDSSRFRVCVVWAPGVENFTYHYVASPKAAAKYIELPGPTEGSMAVIFQERENDDEWYDWYDDEGRSLEEAVDEGAEL
jgi:hypothetical protein